MQTALAAEHDATQAAVAAIPTNPALDTDYTAARAAKLDSLDAAVSSRLAGIDYAAPDNAGIEAIAGEVFTHPALAEMEASAILAKKADVPAITPISVLPFSGSVQASYAQSCTTVEVIQGDSVTIPYDMATDLTGYTAWFAAKKDLADAAYSIALKEITASITDVLNGRGTIPLTTAETNLAPGAYAAEVEIRKGAAVLTAMKFTLKIKGQVIAP